MIVAIHQPNLFPRLKTLQKLALADVWIVLDDVQYCQREFQNRAWIVPLSGNEYWCTLPVTLPEGHLTKIQDVLFDKEQSLQILSNMFKFHFKGNSINEGIYYEIMKNLQNCEGGFSDFVTTSATSLLEIAGLCPVIIKSSELGDKTVGKTEKLISLCKKVGGDTYISDSGGTHYLDEFMFSQSGLKVMWHVWEVVETPLVRTLGLNIRNGSAVNILARSKSEFIDLTSQCKVTRIRHYAEGK